MRICFMIDSVNENGKEVYHECLYPYGTCDGCEIFEKLLSEYEESEGIYEQK